MNMNFKEWFLESTKALQQFRQFYGAQQKDFEDLLKTTVAPLLGQSKPPSNGPGTQPTTPPEVKTITTPADQEKQRKKQTAQIVKDVTAANEKLFQNNIARLTAAVQAAAQEPKTGTTT